MEGAVKYLTEKLKLKVNQQKSAIDNPWNRKFLGFTFTADKTPKRITVHESRVKRFKDKIKGIFKKIRGRNLSESIRKWVMPIVRGWANYFGLAEEQGIFGSLDGWIRRKMRDILWRQWKRPRTRYRRLIALGLKAENARKTVRTSKGPWRMAMSVGMHMAVSNKLIEEMGYLPMATIVQTGS